ncbi:MAG: helix-turn-helix domain-containing protein [Eubacteriales bacterium]
MNTRDRILKEALLLFSEKGFDAVSVRTIAKAVGIKESSLYNHFTGKEDIFGSIISEYNARGEVFFSKMSLTGEDMQFEVDEKTVNMYQTMSPEQFMLIANSIFDFYFTDEINTQMRRMLTMEQYRNRDIAKMFRAISFDAALDYQSRLFEALMDAGSFIKTDPYILALEFFAPIFLLFYKYDNDTDGIAEARELFSRHIAHFRQMYSNDNLLRGN